MGHPNNKVPDYIEQRVAGLAPADAALAAGYAQSGIRVTASRLEQREDVRAALRKAKREGAQLAKAVTGKRKPVPARGEPADDIPPELEPWKLKDSYRGDPLALLLDVMDNPKAPGGLRIQCAKDAMPYVHARKEASKTSEKERESKAASNHFKRQPKPSHLRQVA